jgi:phospholipid/cholesterol/gamma-HCH transport system substrate-binding protein
MTRAIREHVVDFVAILVLLVISLGVGLYVLSKQRLNLPAGVPVLGKDYFKLRAEFQTAQALSPGQGQTVDIAGVQVGEISKVELKNGRALVTMNIQRKFADGKDGRPAIYRDARLLMRPKTGLKDMIIELTPGTPGAGRVPDGGTIPVAQTLPDVNPDEVLAALDADTRQYLVVLLNGARQGLSSGNDRTLADTLRRFEPTARDGLAVTEQLQLRARNVRRVVNNFRKLSEALAGKDNQLAELVDSSNSVFQSFAAQDSNIRSTLRLLPPSLVQTQSTLRKVTTLANTAGPAFQALRPAARNLAPAQLAIRPFLREATPIIRDQIRPFTRIAQPIVAELRPAARDLTTLTPDLVNVFRVLNYAVNELGYNPPGAEEGYLFWLAWGNHDVGGIYSTGDAHGPVRRGQLFVSCSGLTLINSVRAVVPDVGLISGLSNLPFTAPCPGLTATAAARATPRTTTTPDPSGGGLGPAGEGANARGAGNSPAESGGPAPTLTQEPTTTTTTPSAGDPAPRDSAATTTPGAGNGG